MTKAKWSKVLEPFAWEIVRAEERIEKKLAHLSDSKLAEIAEAAKFPDVGNCWWATYQAAKTVGVMVHIEQCNRRARFKKSLRQSKGAK